jgi:hypothetical protein
MSATPHRRWPHPQVDPIAADRGAALAPRPDGFPEAEG